MNRFKSSLLFAVLLVSGFSYHQIRKAGSEATQANLFTFPTTVFASIKDNGKFSDAEKMSETFQQSDWADLGFPAFDENTVLALKRQLSIIRKDKSGEAKQLGNVEANADQMEAVLNMLLERAENGQTGDLHQYLDAWQVNGEDRKGNVKFTGYFTPVLKVSRKATGKYRYPVYAFPEGFPGKMPSRRAIESGALEGKGLELAYADDTFDIYVMQLQGSGTVEYVEDGERVQFTYAGQNGFPYRNIQHFFKNRKDLAIGNVSLDGMRQFLKKNPELRKEVLAYDPSYTFFTCKKGLVKGAAGVPLMADYSVAADSRYFPLGSVLLAAVPVLGEDGKVSHHQYRLLLPQDVGGAVRGQGHVDVYCGNGELGMEKASALHHYGKMWLLLPKDNNQLAVK